MGGDPSIVLVAGRLSSVISHVLDPVLECPFRAVDERYVPIDVLVLDVPIDGPFELEGEPGPPMFSVDVFAGRVLAPDDLQAVMCPRSSVRRVAAQPDVERAIFVTLGSHFCTFFLRFSCSLELSGSRMVC